MRKTTIRGLAVLLAVILLTGSLPLGAAADSTWTPATIQGTYTYTSNEGSNKQCTDRFTYRDDCFMRSSFLGCGHLTALSAKVCLASASRYGEGEDPYDTSPVNNGANLVAMMKAMGFQDVETNDYYNLEKLENSCGVGVGHREIQVDGKTYTLLAIFPRSANYKQEWCGNFTVGNGKMHEGFKAARDEALRFVKQYMKKHNITGDLKVWTAGHSRGSAIANLIGGFFAGGGIAYFDNVSITPEDVYCYAYATPRTILPGLTKKEALSVAGARGGEYSSDTPGAAWTYSGSGTVQPDDTVFTGIRNHPLPYDFIAMLPPPSWGYTYYGQVIASDANGALTVEDMKTELKTISPFAYNAFVNGGDFRNFEWKTFDLPSLSIVKDTKATDDPSMANMLKQRVAGLTEIATDPAAYIEGNYQDALVALAGLYGMLQEFKHLNTDDLTRHIPALVVVYLAYASERMVADGTLSESDPAGVKATAVLCDLLSYLSGEEISPETYTVDDFLVTVLNYLLNQHPDSKLTNLALDNIESLFADAISKLDPLPKMIVDGLLNLFATETDLTLKDKLESFFYATINGPKEGSGAAKEGYSAKECRSYLYIILNFAELPAEAKSVIGSTGAGKFSDLITAILPLLISEDADPTDPDCLENAADKGLISTLHALLDDCIEDSILYGKTYQDQVKAHFADLIENIRPLRIAVTHALLYSGGKFSTEATLRAAVSLLGNVPIIPPAHYNEVNAAWGQAWASHHILDHNPEPTPVPTPAPTEVPKTGDAFSPVLVVLLILLGTAGIAFAVWLWPKRKRGKKG